MPRILDFSDGFESALEPASVPIPATFVSNVPSGNLEAFNVQNALNELQGDIDTINASKAQPNGLATLDGGGKIPVDQIPPISLVDVYTVATIVDRDALVVQEGDVALVTDAGGGVSKTYIYNGSGWLEILADGAVAAHIAQTEAHGATGAVVGTTNTQTLLNKDIDGGTASNARRITLPKDTKTNLDALTRKEATIVYATDQAKAFIDNGTQLIPVGSGDGGGGGGLNYIANPDAELNTDGWVTYADAAQASPVDGTGGTANITFTRSTSSPLRGDASFLFTKDAANRQGEGVSYDFTVDSADQAKVMQIEFDYSVNSGTYVTGDVAAYIVDVTNGTVIQPSAFAVENVGVASVARMTFQTASNSVSYRLCFHVASVSALAYTLKLDNIKLGPQVVPLGAPVTDWVAYTPTLTSSGGGAITLNATSQVAPWGRWRRVGDSVEIFGGFRNGSGGAASGAAGILKFSQPPGILRDTTITSTVSDGVLGAYIGSAYSASATIPVGAYDIFSDGTIGFADNSGGVVNVSDVVAGYAFSFTAKFKVVGWSSSTVVSSSADTRVVAMRATLTTAQTGITDKVIPYNSVTLDTHAGLNTATGVYTVPAPGNYHVVARAVLTGMDGVSSSAFQLRKNGSSFGQSYGAALPGLASFNYIEIQDIVPCVAGDTLSIYVIGDASFSLDNTSGRTAFTVNRISGPSQIAASEVIAGSLRGSPSTGSLNGSVNLITFPITEFDTHGAFSSGNTFTAPAPGLYEIVGGYGATFTAATANQYISVYVRKNGTVVDSYTLRLGASATDATPRVTSLLRLVAGDQITIASQTSVSSGAYISDQTVSVFSVKRLGGVS